MTRNPRRTVLATWFAMISFQTIGSIDAKHKLPAPKQYVAICVAWCILFFAADTGAGRLASRLSGLILLTGMVAGPFGPRVVTFLQMVAQHFAISPPQPQATAPGTAPGSSTGTGLPHITSA